MKDRFAVRALDYDKGVDGWATREHLFVSASWWRQRGRAGSRF